MATHRMAPAPAVGGRGPGALLGGSQHKNRLPAAREQGRAIAPLILRVICGERGEFICLQRVAR